VYARRYATLGALFGLTFPVIGTGVEAVAAHGGLAIAALAAAQGSPLLWIVDSAPLFLGLFAWLAGVRQDRAVAAERAARELAAQAAAELASATGPLDAEVSRIREQAAAHSAATAQEAAAVTETTTTAAEIARRAERAAEAAGEVVAARGRAERLGEDGQAAAAAAVDGMDTLARRVEAIATLSRELAADAERIGAIAEAVTDLGVQSQVLSLNAGLEAARAGAHGAGFGIVAEQMRALADRSRGATAEVSAVVARILKGTERVADAAGEARGASHGAAARVRAAAETIDGLAELARSAADSAHAIAETAQGQGAGIRQIVAAMDDLSTALSGSAGVAGEIQRAAGALAGMSGDLDRRAQAFRARADEGA
jgi:methyl-accepting chemotaxis protein